MTGPTRSNHIIGKAAVVVLLLIVVGAALACESLRSSAEGARNAALGPLTDQKPDIEREVALGETVKIGSIEVTVTGVRSTKGKDMRVRVPPPGEGRLYLLVNVMVKNVGEQEKHISTRQQMNLYDEDFNTQEWALFPASRGTIDGKIEPGMERRAELIWKVDADARGLMIVFGKTGFTLGDVTTHRNGESDGRVRIGM